MTESLLDVDPTPVEAPVHRCGSCGRAIWDARSLARGIGPDCWDKTHPGNVQAVTTHSTAGLGDPDLLDELGGAPVPGQELAFYDQTILVGDPSGRPGDCLRAAVATLLQEPIDRTPHFAEFADWTTAVTAYRDDLAFRYPRREITTPAGATLEHPALFPVLDSAADVVIGIGPSPRGVHHAVILGAFLGGLVFDPHPSRAGLVGPAEFLIIRRP